MTYDHLRKALESVAVTTTTPFREDRSSVHHDALTENLDRLEVEGVSLVIPCGNTGEYYALTHQERIDVVETHVQALESATIVAGAGGSTKTVNALTTAYEAAGVDAVMVMYPRHTYRHRKGLLEYYRRIADNTDLGVVLYKRGKLLSREMIAELSTIENVVGCKYAVNDVNDFARTIEATPGEMTFINGIAERFALSFAIEGATGMTTGIGNVAPRAVLSLFEAIEAGNFDRARTYQDVLVPFEELRAETGEDNDLPNANNVPAVKYALDVAGSYGGPSREPTYELAETDKGRVETALEAIQAVTDGE